MKKIIFLFITVLVFASCSSDEEEIYLTTDISTVYFGAREFNQPQTVTITSNSKNWNYELIYESSDKNWCSLKREGDNIIVSLTEENEEVQRQANVLFYSDDKLLHTIYIIQRSYTSTEREEIQYNQEQKEFSQEAANIINGVFDDIYINNQVLYFDNSENVLEIPLVFKKMDYPNGYGHRNIYLTAELSEENMDIKVEFLSFYITDYISTYYDGDLNDGILYSRTMFNANDFVIQFNYKGTDIKRIVFRGVLESK